MIFRRPVDYRHYAFQRILTKQNTPLNSTNPPEHSEESVRAHALPLTILGISCVLAFLPVLLWPHWGMYSDPRQIIEGCRLFYSSHQIRWEIIWGFHRPGFHILDLAMWLVSKDRPVGFFAFRGLIFFATVLCTFYSSYKFSNWRAISVVCGIALLLLTPTFEVIYTLDKGEVYIGCLFSIIILAYLMVMNKILSGSCSSRWYYFASTVIFICSTYSVLTKETGLLLAPFGLFLPIGCVIANLRTQTFSEIRHEQTVKKKLLRWACLAGFLCIFTSLSCKICFMFLEPSATAYGAFSPAANSMLQQLNFFVPVIPDFFVLFGFCLLSSFWMLRRTHELSQSHNLLFASSLPVTAGAGSLALLVWKAPIIYSWYPLFVFLLPAAAYFLAVITKSNSLCRKIGLLIVISLLVCVAPVRIVQAQIQYDLDSCAQELTRDIAQRASSLKKQESYVLPFPSPGGFELAEELKILTVSQLVDNYTEGLWTAKNLPVLFCNFLNYYFPPGVQPTANSLSDAQVQKLSYSMSDRYIAEPGLGKFYLYNSVNGSSWTIDNLRTGDILLIPFGDLPPALATYRGTPLFCTDWKANVAFVPQADIKPVFVVTRKITRLGGHPYTMGWIGLAINSIPKISWSLSSAGKLFDGAQIFAARQLEGHSLIMTAEMSRPMLIWQHEDGKESPVYVSPINKQLFQIRILLPKTEKGDIVTHLRMQTFGSVNLPTFLRVKSAHIE